MSERSFLRDLRPFEKKKKKNVQKFQSGIFGLFVTAMASRLLGIASMQPTLVTYPNKAETLIADDRLYVWVGYKGGRATFLAGGYPPYTWDGKNFFFKLDLK